MVPVAESLSLRLITFAKLLLDGVPFAKARQLVPVTTAVANLYLRKQIIFERA